MSEKFDKKEFSKIKNELANLGFDEKEARVYLALLQLGETGTTKIMRTTDLHGQYVYQALDRLEEEGLAQHVIKRGRRKYSAKPPRVLVHVAEERKAQAELIAEKLNAMMIVPQEHTFEVYQGDESYITHEFEMLRSAKKDDELLIIGGSGDRFNEVMKGRLGEYVALQKKKGVIIRYVGSEGQRKVMGSLHGNREAFEIRYLPGLFTGQVNTNIWNGTIAFNVYAEPVTRFTVQSPIIAGSYRQFFETLWRLAKV